MKTLRLSFFPLIALGFLLGLAVSSQAQDGNKASFSVKVSGKGKKAILFIPGFYSSGEVWNETISHYQDKYECHTLTLSGFAGEAAAATKENVLLKVRDELVAYIRANKLKKPVLMGHSLGGFLVMWVNATAPDLLGAAIIVDGVPFLPALQMPNATAESAKTMGENIRKMMAIQTKEQVRVNQEMYLPTMIRDKKYIDIAKEWAAASDPVFAAQVMYEMYATDLREEIAKCKAPSLVLGAWIAYKDWGTTRDNTIQRYQAQFAKMPAYQLEMSDTAKHFIMWDEPQWFLEKIDDFLSKTL